MWHKGDWWYHVETDILKEGPVIKHPGRWEIAVRKIPRVKMLYKTNTNCYKYPSIILIIIEQDTVGETKEKNKWHSTQEPRTPKTQSYWLWWGTASPILDGTPCIHWRFLVYENWQEQTYTKNALLKIIHIVLSCHYHISFFKLFS